MSKNRERPRWEGKHYSFFQNTECEYFPCHRIADPARFSCLFCYCPLYMLGPHCGGNFRYTEKGIKDCTGCLIPHLPENYGLITGKYKEIAAAMKRPEQGYSEKLWPEAAPSQKTEKRKVSRNSQELSETEQARPEDRQAENSGNPVVPQDLTDIKSAGINSAGIESAGINSAGIESAGIECAGSKSTNSKSALRERNGKIVLLACTERGFETMRRAASVLKKQLPDMEILQTGRCAYVTGFEDGPRLSEATAKWFHETDALIFIAAAGIAVRCIAPFAQDKFRDPAVLVMDENGRFVISLLSGHAGGANRLCGLLAEAVGAQPVITTATDGRGLFAVDVFATENGLQISDRVLAKQISARILAGETLKICFEEAPGIPADSNEIVSEGKVLSEGEVLSEGKALSEGKVLSRENIVLESLLENYGRGVIRTEDRSDSDIIVSYRHLDGDRENALYLIPRAVTLGIGCRRGTAAETIQKAVQQVLQISGVFRQALAGIASIDLKKEEVGLHAFAQAWDLALTFYTAEELARVPGTFSASEFVRNITGVDCVCERSAVRLAMDRFYDGQQAYLLEKKQSLDGVTAALAVMSQR